MQTHPSVAATALVVLATMMLAALPAHAQDHPGASARSRVFNLVNTTADSVVAVQTAPSAGGEFSSVMLGEPLQGGMASTAIHVPTDDCLRDIGVDFRGGRHVVFKGIDVCRSTGLRLTAMPASRHADKPDEPMPAVARMPI